MCFNRYHLPHYFSQDSALTVFFRISFMVFLRLRGSRFNSSYSTLFSQRKASSFLAGLRHVMSWFFNLEISLT